MGVARPRPEAGDRTPARRGGRREGAATHGAGGPFLLERDADAGGGLELVAVAVEEDAGGVGVGSGGRRSPRPSSAGRTSESAASRMSNMKLLPAYPGSMAAGGSSVQRMACRPPRLRVTVRAAPGNGSSRPSTDRTDRGRAGRGTAGVGPGSTASVGGGGDRPGGPGGRAGGGAASARQAEPSRRRAGASRSWPAGWRVRGGVAVHHRFLTSADGRRFAQYTMREWLGSPRGCRSRRTPVRDGAGTC